MRKLCFTLRACKVLTITEDIGAIDVPFSRRIAVEAPAYNPAVFRMVDLNGYPLIKDVTKPIPQSPLGLFVLAIRYNATIELIHIAKSVGKHKGRELFASDATGAIG